MSASDSDAAITTAASVGLGQVAQQARARAAASAAIATAPTRPVTCVLAPACSATAVREPLVLTGKPWKSPAPRLAAPIPIISRLPSTSSPDPAGERGRGRDRVGERDQRDAERPADQRAAGRSSCTSGTVSGGNPSGSVPTSFDAVLRRGRRRAAAAIDTTTATSTPGHLGQQPLQDDDHRQAEHADGQRGGRPCRRRATPSTNARASSTKPLASTEKPNSLGSWPTRIVSASPFM